MRGAGAAPGGGGKILAQFCVDALLARISAAPSRDERHRLHLALVSLLSSLPVSLLPGTLQHAKRVISAEDDAEMRGALVDALYQELLEKVGDRGKAVAVREWHEARVVLARGVENEG